MVKVLQWLFGYVHFRFEKGFIEGFINDCYERSLNIQQLVRDGNILYGKCSIKTYLFLHRVARRNGGVLCAYKRCGPIFALLKLRTRLGLFVGAFCFVMIVNFLSGFVWSVEINGNSRISNEVISSFLEDNGLYKGAYADSINRDVIENLVMASFDDCAWAHINIDGTTAVVEIDETVVKPKVVDKSVITNVKATKAGIIVKSTAFDGWTVAKPGDMVKENDLLISGVFAREDGDTNHFTHARGEVLANVEEPFEMTISRQQCKKRYIDEKVFKSVYIYGVKIPLYIGSSDYINTDTKEDISFVEINKSKLPIGIITKTSKRFEVQTAVLNDKELNALVKNEIDKKINREFSDFEIIKKDIDISLDGSQATVKGTITCLEDIAKEVKVNISRK